jgi:hypothetical protein
MNTAQRIKAAAMRMQDAGVIIDSEADADRLHIDARSLEGIPDESVFFLEGEPAANLISEAQAYAEGVTFDEALAFVVEGYLDNYKEDAPRKANTVREAINAEFWCGLSPEIAGIEADCVVGEAVVKLLTVVHAICTRVYAEDGGAMESHYVLQMKHVALRQCNCWYFG